MISLDPILDRLDRLYRLAERGVAALEAIAARTASAEPSKTSPSELWTVKQVAAFLNCSASDVYRKAEAGELPRLKVGVKVRFEPEVVRAYARGERPPGARVLPLTPRG